MSTKLYGIIEQYNRQSKKWMLVHFRAFSEAKELEAQARKSAVWLKGGDEAMSFMIGNHLGIVRPNEDESNLSAREIDVRNSVHTYLGDFFNNRYVSRAVPFDASMGAQFVFRDMATLTLPMENGETSQVIADSVTFTLEDLETLSTVMALISREFFFNEYFSETVSVLKTAQLLLNAAGSWLDEREIRMIIFNV